MLGSVLGLDKTTAPVDLDQLFNTLDPKTRKSLQNVIQGSAAQYRGRGKQANEALKYFNPALSTTSRLVNELDRDQQSLQQWFDTSHFYRFPAANSDISTYPAWTGIMSLPGASYKPKAGDTIRNGGYQDFGNYVRD